MAGTSCEVKLDDPLILVSKTNPVGEISTRELNILGSDYLNMDSIEFRFNQYKIQSDPYKIVIEFVSNQTNQDILTLAFEKFNGNMTTPYYCKYPQANGSINKLNANKIISVSNSGNLIFDQFSDDSANIIFEFDLMTSHRLPNNTNLKAKINGRFRIPSEK